VTIRRRLCKLEKALTPSPRKSRLCMVAVADDGRTVCRLFYDDGQNVKPEGMTVGDLPREGPYKVYIGIDPDAV
jgi:hypothetical protein